MDDFKEKYYKRNPYEMKYSNNCAYNRTSYRNNCKHDSKYYRRCEKDSFHLSQSTLCVPHHARNHSKSTLCMPPHPRIPSKSTLVTPHQFRDKHIIGKDVSTLPYYIVPVLYVPHKPLYEAKQLIEPHLYKAYHCKSKSQLVKGSGKCCRYPPKLSASKSLLDLYSKKNYKEFDDLDSPRKRDDSDTYSFEYYDEYFRKYVDGKRSSSDISFCTEKSFAHFPATPKRSAKLHNETYDLCSEKRKSISKDFPELFGLYATSKDASESLRPKTCQEEPTWDFPRTADAFIETESAEKSCISAQTSFDALKQDMQGREKKKDTQGTQTVIKDIKKNVLVVPNDFGFKRSFRREPITEEVPRNVRDPADSKDLKAKRSEGQLDTITKRTYSFNRSTPRFAVSRLTKSATPNSYGTSKKSSKRSINSDNSSFK